MSSWQSIALLFFLFQTFSSITQASVPASDTFKFVNNGDFGFYDIEYNANYRLVLAFEGPFGICFYNTTPNSYTLGIRMGTPQSETPFRWVWEANRGNPVGENATFSFGRDGNLVLAEADGRVAWQSGTANKGVVGYKLVPNGNIVLHDAKGHVIWQSFDYPTDTLLVGQSLRVGGPIKLVSRASETININGQYILVLEPQMLVLYNKTSNSARPMSYFVYISKGQVGESSLEFVKFNSVPKTHELEFDYKLSKSSIGGSVVLSKPTFDSTLTFLRLGIDGNVKAFTYNLETDTFWETYTLLSR